jgi:hypothetical protein
VSFSCFLPSTIFAADLQNLVSASNDFEVEMIEHEHVLERSSSATELSRGSCEVRKIVEDGQEGSLLIAHAPAIPLSSIWSFCRRRQQFVAADFGPRGRDICGLYEEYDEDCKKPGKLLLLMEWLDEKEARENFLGQPF